MERQERVIRLKLSRWSNWLVFIAEQPVQSLAVVPGLQAAGEANFQVVVEVH